MCDNSAVFLHHVEVAGSGAQVDPKGSDPRFTWQDDMNAAMEWSKRGRYSLSAPFWLRGRRAQRNQTSPELSTFKVMPNFGSDDVVISQEDGSAHGKRKGP